MSKEGSIGKYQTEKEFRAVVDEAQTVLGSLPPRQLPDADTSHQRNGLRAQAQYVVHVLKEFTVAFGYPAEALGIPTTRVLNEYSIVEEVVLLRAGRTAVLFGEMSYDFVEATMTAYIRKGQSSKTFQCLRPNSRLGTPQAGSRLEVMTVDAARPLPPHVRKSWRMARLPRRRWQQVLVMFQIVAALPLSSSRRGWWSWRRDEQKRLPEPRAKRRRCSWRRGRQHCQGRRPCRELTEGSRSQGRPLLAAAFVLRVGPTAGSAMAAVVLWTLMRC